MQQHFGIIQNPPQRRDASSPGREGEREIIVVTGGLRVALENAIVLYDTRQTTLTLEPRGVTGYNADVTLQGQQGIQAALVYEIVIDAPPSMVAVAIRGNSYNVSSFGRILTSDILLTKQWIHRNLLSTQGIILVGREQIIPLSFTNRSFQQVDIVVTSMLGLLMIDQANRILVQFGKNELV